MRTRPTSVPTPQHPSSARRGALRWLLAVRVPLQHGVFALSTVAGAVAGALLAGMGTDEAQLLPGWLPEELGSALLSGSLLGAALAGAGAWLLCRPRRAQRWTIDYAGQRLVGLRGVGTPR